MKNKKNIVLLDAIIVLVIACSLIGCTKTEVQVKDEGNVQTDITGNQEEVWVKRDLKEISGDYTLEEANLDKAFIIGNDNFPKNKSALNLFTDELGANKQTSLRVVMETPDSLLSIIDLETSGDYFVVTQNDRQMSGDITENVYARSEYSFVDRVVTLEDGVLLQSYLLSKENFEEVIELFAYILEPNNASGDVENEIIESGEQEKVIEISE